MSSTTLPGSYFSDLDLNLDNPTAAAANPTIVAGARSNFFQAPYTPSASSSLYRDDTDTASTTTMGTTTTTSSRKRARQEYPDSSWSPDFIAAGCASPAPFVNTKYRLAGGLDTPMAAEEEAREEGSRYYSDVGYRRAWTGSDMSPMGSFRYTGGSGASGGSTGGGAWSKAVLDAVGGVAGKVWEFCKSSAFRGFYAGGGAGYQLRNAPSAQRINNDGDDEDERFWQDLDPTAAAKHSTPLTPTPTPHHTRHSRSSTPIPGQYPPDDDYYIPPTPSPRPAKRVLRDKGGGELKMSWVMVPTPGRTPREKGGPSTATAVGAGGRSSKRSTPMASMAGTSAGPSRRKVITPHSHHSQHNHHHYQHSHRTTTPSSSLPRASTTASYASPRSTPTPNPLIAKRLREEKEADRSIQRFNERLKDMIREGREALGSRWDVEVELDGEGDGEEELGLS
ncbi:hypothetical protein FGG08_007327 [Glutinoglossum americanum]|uniref:Uncharacterized protein n=1 Tax=Glutinoglossum americanum TaxID=1670608 RepID=A0A9P8L119_9PEZI|nr:hypothetical protein FGG08_007327 [Glutinoglossum americanum]